MLEAKLAGRHPRGRLRLLAGDVKNDKRSFDLRKHGFGTSAESE